MRLGDLDALKEKINAFYDSLFVGCVSSDLITFAKGVDEIIDNAPTVSERPQGDLISRSELKKAFNKWWSCDDIPATVVEDLIDEAPTVESDEVLKKKAETYATAYRIMSTAFEGEVRKHTRLANEVWKLYEKYQSHLATSVIEFGDELKELLGKYHKGGAE